MTEAMPFLRKLILLSYDPRPWCRGRFLRMELSVCREEEVGESGSVHGDMEAGTSVAGKHDPAVFR